MSTGVEGNITLGEATPDLGYLGYFASTGIPRNEQFRIASDDQRTVFVNRTITTLVRTDPIGFEWAELKYRNANSIGELPDSSVKEVEFYSQEGGPTQNQSLLSQGCMINSQNLCRRWPSSYC